MRITIVQTAISWENKKSNLDKYENIAKKISGNTDIMVLPEMCTTGFSMNSEELAEDNNGNTIKRIKEISKNYDIAITGSFINKKDKNYYNEGFFITPTQTYFYNKRHLFSMGKEKESYSAGKNHTTINYKGWNIRLVICYDLRFPVFLRNKPNYYDLLIVVANWPKPRILVWDTLLKARALENQCYVCGVNRIGTDNNNLEYNGLSNLITPYGKTLSTLKENQEGIETHDISLDKLKKFREKFPVLLDADNFEII